MKERNYEKSAYIKESRKAEGLKGQRQKGNSLIKKLKNISL